MVGVLVRLPPIPGWILTINSVIVTIAVLTLGFLGAVYLLRKVLKKRSAFNPTRVFIAVFLIVLLTSYLFSYIATLIYGIEASLGHASDPAGYVGGYIAWGMLWSVPSSIVAAVSALIYKFRMHVRKRVFAAGGIVLAVGFILQLCVSAFIVRQWLPYQHTSGYFDVFEIIPDWMINLNYPISTVIMAIGILTIACSLLYKPIKTYSLQLKQRM